VTHGRDAVKAQRTSNPARSRIAYGLSAAYSRAGEPQPFDLNGGKLIIFSDHHRGKKDGADDFRRCERAYRAALGHYVESGHTLALLGDVEELWENQLPEPLQSYPEALELERRLHDEGRMWRFYGNHDLVWSRPGHVRKYLSDVVGPRLEVLEARKLDVYEGADKLGQLFLTHGHQGTPDSDLFAREPHAGSTRSGSGRRTTTSAEKPTGWPMGCPAKATARPCPTPANSSIAIRRRAR
jgi:hypothetical protein